MNFSIKAIIRAWWAPESRLSCPAKHWRQIVNELERRGQRQHEAGVFLLGTESDGRRVVRDAVFYDDLDADAYVTGVCVLHGDAFAKLWARCREKGLMVVADAHTHPGLAFQSGSDRTNPMVARAGHIAIIVPDYGRWPIRPHKLGVFEYRGRHEWIDRSPARSPSFFYAGLWS